MRLLAIAVPVALLCACASLQVGHDFDLGGFQAKVQRGVTTQADVRNWLGDPAGTGVSVDTNGEQFEEWSYYHGQGDLPDAGNAHLKMLQIKFDAHGIVRGYNWTGGPK